MTEKIEETFQQIDPNDFRDFHAVYTVQLCELIHDGLIDFADGTWEQTMNGCDIDWYSTEQMQRFWKKFQAHYMYREIGELPYLRWKTDVLSRCALVMPKYKLMYKALEDADPLQTSDEYGKLRYINSTFPQTLLSQNSDYASDGTDREYETVKQGNLIETLNEIALKYADVDERLVKEFSNNFYSLLSCEINGF